VARKNEWHMRSNFATARKMGDAAMADLIHVATDKMHEVAQTRLESQASRRGYNLDAGDIDKQELPMDGRISYPHFYGRFFEYGTVHIPALPFIRPGHRAGRKVIKNQGIAAGVFKKWIPRARVR
jgi:hypothetical protein